MTAKLQKTDSPPTSAQLRFLRQPQVLARVGVAWITIMRWEAAGLFPKRRKLGERVVGWVEAEIDEWCASKATQGSEFDQ